MKVKLREGWYKVPAVRERNGSPGFFLQKHCPLPNHSGFDILYYAGKGWVANDRSENQRCYACERGSDENNAWRAGQSGLIGVYATAELAMDAVDEFDPLTKVWDYSNAKV